MGVKLILFPLIIMGLVSVISFAGVGSAGMFGHAVIYRDRVAIPVEGDGFYDENGHLLAYLNQTCSGETGLIVDTASNNIQDIGRYVPVGGIAGVPEYFWYNGSDAGYGFGWQLSGYRFPAQKVDSSNTMFGFDASSGIGLMGILVAVGAMMMITTLTIMGSGVKAVSVLAVLMCGIFVGLWWVLSAAAGSLLQALPLSSGWIGYFFMSLCYVVGVLQMVTSGGGGAD